MELLNISKKKLACGLEWEILTDAGNAKREMKDIAAKIGCTYGMFFKFEDTVSAGFSTKKFSSAPAGLMLAFAHQNFLLNDIDRNSTTRKDWIYIDKDGEKIWMCVVKDGVVTPGMDCVFTSMSDLENKISEVLSIVDTYLVYTPLPEIQTMFYNKGFNTPVIIETFDSLVSKVEIKTLNKIKLQKLTGIPPVFIGLGFLFLLLVIAYFFYEDFIDKKKQQDAINATKAIAFAEAQKQQEAYKEEVKKYYQSFISAKNEAFKQATVVSYRDSNDIVSKILEEANVKIDFNGWDITDIKCKITPVVGEVKDTIKCEKGFKKGEIGTNQSLVNIYPKAYLSSPLAKDAKVDFEVVSTPLSDDISKYDFINLDDFAISFISKVENLKNTGIELSIPQDPEEITFATPIIPLSKEQIEAGETVPQPTNKKIGYSKGIFVVKGKGLSEMKEFVNYIGWSSFAINSVEFDYSNKFDVKWSMEINYILKTTPEDLTPPAIGTYNAKDFGL